MHKERKVTLTRIRRRTSRGIGAARRRPSAIAHGRSADRKLNWRRRQRSNIGRFVLGKLPMYIYGLRSGVPGAGPPTLSGVGRSLRRILRGLHQGWDQVRRAHRGHPHEGLFVIRNGKRLRASEVRLATLARLSARAASTPCKTKSTFELSTWLECRSLKLLKIPLLGKKYDTRQWHWFAQLQPAVSAILSRSTKRRSTQNHLKSNILWSNWRVDLKTSFFMGIFGNLCFKNFNERGHTRACFYPRWDEGIKGEGGGLSLILGVDAWPRRPENKKRFRRWTQKLWTKLMTSNYTPQLK